MAFKIQLHRFIQNWVHAHILQILANSLSLSEQPQLVFAVRWKGEELFVCARLGRQFHRDDFRVVYRCREALVVPADWFGSCDDD